MEIKLLEVAGLEPMYAALHLPFGKGVVKTRSEDKTLLKKLILAGPEHAKVTRGLMYWIQIDAPVYWWREMETYRTGRERLSCESTMHIDCKGLTGAELQKAKAEIPMGKEQRAIDMFSAQCLRNIYKQRRHHRLPEWKQFCEFIKMLPHADEFITCVL